MCITNRWVMISILAGEKKITNELNNSCISTLKPKPVFSQPNKEQQKSIENNEGFSLSFAFDRINISHSTNENTSTRVRTRERETERRKTNQISGLFDQSGRSMKSNHRQERINELDRKTYPTITRFSFSNYHLDKIILQFVIECCRLFMKSLSH